MIFNTVPINYFKFARKRLTEFLHFFRLLEWKDNGYDVMKYKRKISDVRCLLFTKESLLFSSANEYFSINLNTYTENSKNSIYFFL